jgi:hypothetical protein
MPSYIQTLCIGLSEKTSWASGEANGRILHWYATISETLLVSLSAWLEYDKHNVIMTGIKPLHLHVCKPRILTALHVIFPTSLPLSAYPQPVKGILVSSLAYTLLAISITSHFLPDAYWKTQGTLCVFSCLLLPFFSTLESSKVYNYRSGDLIRHKVKFKVMKRVHSCPYLDCCHLGPLPYIAL